MRYSDSIPYDKRRFWYFTTHGLGPGTLPKGVNVLATQEGKNQKGTNGLFICLDAILDKSELDYYDLIELRPGLKILKFECDEDLIKIADREPLLIESGTSIAYMKYLLDAREEEIEIVVCGDIRILYKGEYYFRPNEYTEELKQILRMSHIERLQIDDFEILENNWCEIRYTKNGEWQYNAPVCDGEFGKTQEEVKNYLIETAKLLVGFI